VLIPPLRYYIQSSGRYFVRQASRFGYEGVDGFGEGVGWSCACLSRSVSVVISGLGVKGAYVWFSVWRSGAVYDGFFGLG